MAENVYNDMLFLEAVLKSIKITKQDAEFEEDNPPKGILKPIRMNLLRDACLQYNPQKFLDQLLLIECNRNILKRDLKFLVNFHFNMQPNSIAEKKSFALLRKYKGHTKFEFFKNIQFEVVNVSDFYNFMTNIQLTFPDLVYCIMKKNPHYRFSQSNHTIITSYKNFKPEYQNIGLFALLPKGKKYGGFAKAIIHIYLITKLTPSLLEELLAFGRCIYNSPITPHNKREEWFTKLDIKECDCLAWTKVFNEVFPNHTDINKYFGQIA